MTIDPRTPSVTVHYMAIGGPLAGRLLTVDGRTPVFLFFEGLDLQGALHAGNEPHYRVQNGQLVWVEGTP